MISNDLDDNLMIFVFSYNRGRALQNCISTIAALNPTLQIIVIDDNSDDLYTRHVLSIINSTPNCKVITKINDFLLKKVGGLPVNMDFAIEYANKLGKKYVIFIQDDMQFVRSINSLDIDIFDDTFSRDIRSMQIFTCFINSVNLKWTVKLGQQKIIPTIYRREDFDSGSGYKKFSAVGLFHVERTTQMVSSFKSEKLMNETFSTIESDLLFYRFPFMHWTPFPESHRDRGKSFIHILLEKLSKSGVHPIRFIYAKSSFPKKLSLNEKGVLPIAERNLISDTAPFCFEWSTIGGKANLFRRLLLPGKKSFRIK